jgi:hypothetical protein
LFYRFPGFWKLPPPGLPWLYIVTDWNLECRAPLARALLKNAGSKILKNPGKMPFSTTGYSSWIFYNESFVGKFCENLQGNMRLSATHRLPPAKKPSSQHVKHLNPIFSKILGIRGVLCTLCSPHRMPPKTYTNVSILMQNLRFFNEKHGLKDCINLLFHMNNSI